MLQLDEIKLVKVHFSLFQNKLRGIFFKIPRKPNIHKFKTRKLKSKKNTFFFFALITIHFLQFLHTHKHTHTNTLIYMCACVCVCASTRVSMCTCIDFIICYIY